MYDMVVSACTLILIHTSTREQCQYVKNANNDLRILQNSHLKNKNKTLQLKKSSISN